MCVSCSCVISCSPRDSTTVMCSACDLRKWCRLWQTSKNGKLKWMFRYSIPEKCQFWLEIHIHKLSRLSQRTIVKSHIQAFKLSTILSLVVHNIDWPWSMLALWKSLQCPPIWCVRRLWNTGKWLWFLYCECSVRLSFQEVGCSTGPDERSSLGVLPSSCNSSCKGNTFFFLSWTALWGGPVNKYHYVQG